MAAQSKEQKETVERVMHEFKQGELESSSGKKVRNPKQAIAIALHEAGASKYESDEENEKNLKRTKQRERRGDTAPQSVQSEEGRGGNAGVDAGREKTKQQLYDEAREKNVEGRSKMSREELAQALDEADD